jgi:energy-coupling factor transport system ATP-binding protein
LRVAEIASYFGIQNWFYKNVEELSGGQKQLLVLASVMALQPSVLILDEPTSRLDPIAASEFLTTINKINRELGVTVLMTEHRLEEALPLSDRLILLEKGQIVADGHPAEIGTALKNTNRSMFQAMPVPMRVHAAVENNLPCPVTLREGRNWFDQICHNRKLLPIQQENYPERINPAVELDEVWFRYEKDQPNVLKGLSFSAYPGEIAVLLGGNGTGKTTALRLMCGILTPQRGKGHFNEERCYLLPQNPQSLFICKTVMEDLLEVFAGMQLDSQEKEQRLAQIVALCQLEELLSVHPYDLSGGEQQRAALAKVLLLKPRLLLLDEPTKGLDAEFKLTFAGILRELTESGVAIVIVSHDVEFCAAHADRCALFFDGSIVSEDNPRAFFSGNNFYTTAANRMARHILPEAITPEDLVVALGGDPKLLEPPRRNEANSVETQAWLPMTSALHTEAANKKETTLPNPVAESKSATESNPEKQALQPRTLIAAVMILLSIPLTIYVGTNYLDDRKYYFISMLIIFEAMVPFFLIFEKRKPQIRELIIIALLCALAVVGRAVFFMVPQFKPVIAIVIIAGVAFGGEVGFLVGALTAFVSNMYFGQGPWTPWQMFSLGIIGFLAGILFSRGMTGPNRLALCLFGGLATLLIYGPIVNSSFIFTYQPNPTTEMFYVALLQGLPLDLIHAFATVVFLYIIARPMLEKLDRIKIKYGLITQR